MADDIIPENDQASEQPEQGNFGLQRIYVKDVSFEAPNVPEVFRKQWKPEVKMDMGTKNKSLGNDLYEVIVSVTVTTSVEDMTAYIVEVQQAGIIMVKGLEGTQLAQTLNAYCPNLLFPYLREAIDNVLVKGSFPALMLAPLNFDAIFAQAVAQKQKEAASAADESTSH